MNEPLINRGSWSYGTRSVPTTINVYLFLAFTNEPQQKEI